MRLATTILLALVLAAMPARGLAVEPVLRTTGAELAGAAIPDDGVTVAFDGEVVSEVLRGGDGHSWVNVLSDGVAIGVWLPTRLTGDLEVFGDWGHTGDTVAVTGTFNEACDVHGGDLDVHAAEFALIERGVPRQHPITYWKLAIGLGSLAVAYIGFRRVWRRQSQVG